MVEGALASAISGIEENNREAIFIDSWAEEELD